MNKKVCIILASLNVLLCSCNGGGSRKVNLTQSNYTEYIKVDARVEDIGTAHYFYISCTRTSSKYKFEGFCYLHLRLDYSYYGRVGDGKNGEASTYFNVTLDSYGNGEGGNSRGNMAPSCEEVFIKRVEPSGRDGVIGTVIV